MRATSANQVRCTECQRSIDEKTLVAERWGFWSDGFDLNPFCPECAKREFSVDAPASFERSRLATLPGSGSSRLNGRSEF